MHHFWALRKERGRVICLEGESKERGSKGKNINRTNNRRVTKLKRAFLSSTHDSIPFFSNLSTTRV